MEMERTFNSQEVEKRLVKIWQESNAFAAGANAKLGKGTFSIVIPPPNVTGNLHMGHAFNNTIQDILVRWHRMRGFDTLWQPGQDHAGIATQMVVERELQKNENLSREKLGREKFLEKVWEWKEESGGAIIEQLKRLGASCDWQRNRFTMDEAFHKSVLTAFVEMYNAGHIYRGERLVNWDPHFKTAISDLEVENIEVDGHFWHIKYPLTNGEKYEYVTRDLDGKVVSSELRNYISIATTRPETMLGDGAVAVHPEDDRYKHIIGKHVILPLTDRHIPIIGDEYPDPNFGSGAVKITGAHDFNDYEVAKRHGLEFFILMDEAGKMVKADYVPSKYRGLDRFDAREEIVKDLESEGLLLNVEQKKIVQPFGDRSKVVVEPYLTKQWFVNANAIVEPAIKAVKDGRTQIFPERDTKTYFNWLENIEPWCISRQLWWGHQIPVWYDEDGNQYCAISEKEARRTAGQKKLVRDPDVLDTWFSSGLWPIGTMGWPNETAELERYFPTNVLVTGFDILFFWVARMMMMQLALVDQVPFQKVYVHALVRDEKGKKMSKSLGNVLDPLDLIDEYGADAVRFSLASMAVMGRDIKLSTDRVVGYRNFGTKIWNAARYGNINSCISCTKFDPCTVRNTLNKWIIGETVRVKMEVDKSLQMFRFNDVANSLYRHVWGKFCDWYLEFSKPLLSGNEAELRAETQSTFAWVLDQCLIMLHPIMPFITEEIWGKTGFRENLIVHQAWPEFTLKNFWDQEAHNEISWIIDLVEEIRSVRVEMNIPAGMKISMQIFKINSKVSGFLSRNEIFVKQLGRIAQIENINKIQDGSISISIPGAEFCFPLAGVIDVSNEKLRLEKKLQKLQSEYDMLKKKLQNEKFLTHAPTEVVEDIKVRSATLLSEMKKKKLALSRLTELS